MESIFFVLLPAAFGFVLAAGVVFWWAARGGQFDDLETPAARVLVDDDPPSVPGGPVGGPRT